MKELGGGGKFQKGDLILPQEIFLSLTPLEILHYLQGIDCCRRPITILPFIMWPGSLEDIWALVQKENFTLSRANLDKYTKGVHVRGALDGSAKVFTIMVARIALVAIFASRSNFRFIKLVTHSAQEL